MRFVKIESTDIVWIDSIINLECELFGDGGLNIWAIQPLCEYQMVYALIDSYVRAYAIILSKVGDSETVYVFSFGVSPKEQGKGIGKLLLSELIVKMKELAFSKLELTVSQENQIALNLYKSKMQTLSTSFIKSCYGDGEDREKILFKI